MFVSVTLISYRKDNCCHKQGFVKPRVLSSLVKINGYRRESVGLYGIHIGFPNDYRCFRNHLTFKTGFDFITNFDQPIDNTMCVAGRVGPADLSEHLMSLKVL